ncbi:hypothetical protein P7K49_012892 [Saguinus oedipus]|uniref:Uncharacterized protein n=1 Tax=Saguinus oedipus TaxID=9490 RepID=A0ABQ9VER5_SAGOE|nr:hypothetical protein P7K49_012892 [Saguinus oedipus]
MSVPGAFNPGHIKSPHTQQTAPVPRTLSWMQPWTGAELDAALDGSGAGCSPGRERSWMQPWTGVELDAALDGSGVGCSPARERSWMQPWCQPWMGAELDAALDGSGAGCSPGVSPGWERSWMQPWCQPWMGAELDAALDGSGAGCSPGWELSWMQPWTGASFCFLVARLVVTVLGLHLENRVSLTICWLEQWIVAGRAHHLPEFHVFQSTGNHCPWELTFRATLWLSKSRAERSVALLSLAHRTRGKRPFLPVAEGMETTRGHLGSQGLRKASSSSAFSLRPA